MLATDMERKRNGGGTAHSFFIGRMSATDMERKYLYRKNMFLNTENGRNSVQPEGKSIYTAKFGHQIPDF